VKTGIREGIRQILDYLLLFFFFVMDRFRALSILSILKATFVQHRHVCCVDKPYLVCKLQQILCFAKGTLCDIYKLKEFTRVRTGASLSQIRWY